MTELSGKVDTLLRDAHAQAEARGHPFVGTEHLLLAMTRQSEDCFARRLLDEAGVTNTLRRAHRGGDRAERASSLGPSLPVRALSRRRLALVPSGTSMRNAGTQQGRDRELEDCVGWP